jgi:hypothetical protein
MRQKHSWIEEKPTCHKTPHATLIIGYETYSFLDGYLCYHQISIHYTKMHLNSLWDSLYFE